MSWVLAVGLALGAFVAMAALFRLPRLAWSSVLAALALGLAGYAAQGNPAMPGSPRAAAQEVSGEGENLVELRRAVLPPEQWSQHNALITADALARRDRFSDAATMLLGAVRGNPRDGEAWLALGNALVEHADGALTQPALLAYRRAAELDPTGAGPGYFLGFALIRQGRLMDARGVWASTLETASEDAAGREGLEESLARLDALIANQGVVPR